MYSRPNWPRLMNSPTPTIVVQDATGRGTITANAATTAKRMATNSSGGMPGIPQSMTRKLKPQAAATPAARIMSRRLTASVHRLTR
ncbi:hypothetical protein RKD05_001750 [Microbacterium sp. SLBN-111]